MVDESKYAKTSQESQLEQQMAEAKLGKEGAIAQAQIEVYEGQNYEKIKEYNETIQRRNTVRSKLPEKIPEDKVYKEKLLEAQYIRNRITSPTFSNQIQLKEYEDEIKNQQIAKTDLAELERKIPFLYSSAIEEETTVNTKVESARIAEEEKQTKIIFDYQSSIDSIRTSRENALAKAQADEAEKERLFQEQSKGAKWDKLFAVPYVPFGVGDLQVVRVNQRGNYYYNEVVPTQQYYARAIAQTRQMFATTGGVNFSMKDYNDLKIRANETKSGKLVDIMFFEKVDPARKDAMATDRRQAAGNVASAYSSMSATEKSKANASLYATNPALKKENDMAVLREVSGGLLGGQSFKVAEGSTPVYFDKTGVNVTATVAPIIEKQRQIELANMRQTQYVTELRAGNISLFGALSNPQTTQSYEGKSTINTVQFLKERGLTIESAPNSLLSANYSEKLNEAREQTRISENKPMGDLTTLSPYYVGLKDQPYQMTKASEGELLKRQQAQERIDQFKPTTPSGITFNEEAPATKFMALQNPEIQNNKSVNVRTAEVKLPSDAFTGTLSLHPNTKVSGFNYNQLDKSDKSIITSNTAQNKIVQEQMTTALYDKGKKFDNSNTIVTAKGFDYTQVDKSGKSILTSNTAQNKIVQDQMTTKLYSTGEKFENSNTIVTGKGFDYTQVDKSGKSIITSNNNKIMQDQMTTALYDKGKKFDSTTSHPNANKTGFNYGLTDKSGQNVLSSNVSQNKTIQNKIFADIEKKGAKFDSQSERPQTFQVSKPILTPDYKTTTQVIGTTLVTTKEKINKDGWKIATTKTIGDDNTPIFTTSIIKPKPTVSPSIVTIIEKSSPTIKGGLEKVEPTKLKLTSESIQLPTTKSNPYDFDPIAVATGQKWIVTTNEKTFVPTQTGQVLQLNAPVTNEFNTLAEAQRFAKNNKPKVFSGTTNDLWNRYQYASAVDSGELPEPTALIDKARYYSSVYNRPFINLGASIINLATPADKQIPIYQTTTERLISGSIDDTIKLDPIKGTGVVSAWEYVSKDPLRTVLESPAEVAMWVTGGKAISLTTKGLGVSKTILATSKVIPQPIKNIGTAIATKVDDIKQAPENMWINVAGKNKILKEIDMKIAYVGKQRVGISNAMNLRYTLGGRQFLKDTVAIDDKIKNTPSKVDGKLVDTTMDIKNKNKIVIETSDEDKFLVTRKMMEPQGVILPKYNIINTIDKPNLLTNAKQWGSNLRNKITDTKMIRQAEREASIREEKLFKLGKGYLAKNQSDPIIKSTKNQINESQMILKDKIKSQIYKAKTDLAERKYKIETMLQRSKASVTDFGAKSSEIQVGNNLKNTLSNFKQRQQAKLNESIENFKDRAKTNVTIYREIDKSVGVKAFLKSTPEGRSAISKDDKIIKTALTYTEKPTKYTTGIVQKGSKEYKELEKLGEGFEKKIYKNETPIMWYAQQKDPALKEVGETFTLSGKDYLKMKGNDITKTFEQGGYYKIQKGNLVKTGEVKALQVEDPIETQKKILKNVNDNKIDIEVGEIKYPKGFSSKSELKKSDDKLSDNIITDTKSTGSGGDSITSNKNNQSTITTNTAVKDNFKEITKAHTDSLSPKKSIYKSAYTGSAIVSSGLSSNNRMVSNRIEGSSNFNTNNSQVILDKSDNRLSNNKFKEVLDEHSDSLTSKTSLYKSAYAGSAILFSGLKSKDKILEETKTETISISDVSTVNALQHKEIVKNIQDTGLREKTNTNQKRGMILKTGVKLLTGQALITKAPLDIPQRFKYQPPKVPVVINFDIEDNKRRKKKSIGGKRSGFIGNVRLDNIMGVYKRKEITYGEQRIARLEAQDKRISRRTKNRIANPSGLLKEKKRYKSRTENILGQTRSKSKDEFSGFKSVKVKSKKSKRTKSRRKSII